MRLRTVLQVFCVYWTLVGTVHPASAPAPDLPPGALRWTSGNLPPFVWFNQNGPQGYAYELVVLISAKLGRQSDVAFYPWARAVRTARENEDHGVFPLARTPDRESNFQWLIPLAHVRYTFFARAGGHADPNSPQTLRVKRIGVLRGSPVIKLLRDRNFTTLVEAQDYKELVRMLSEGVVDAAYGGSLMINVAIEQFGHKPRDFRVGVSLDQTDLYMAASLNADAAEVERWQRAYRELQQEGAVARLQKKYFREH